MIKYLGIVVTILLAVLISLGLAIPSFEYTSVVSINASPGKCWAVLHDTSRMKKWVSGFERLTLKSGNHFQAGAVYELIIRQKERYVMREVMKEIKAPELASFELTNDVLRSEYDFMLAPKDSKTEITAHYSITGNNLMWKSILVLSKSYLQDEAQTQLDLLKIEIETGDLEFD